MNRTTKHSTPSPKHLKVDPLADEATSAEVLEELAGVYPAVRERLERQRLAGNPAALAKVFKANLQRLKAGSRYHGWRDVGRYAMDLEVWIAQVSNEVLPVAPQAAQDLLLDFIESDAYFFDHADDSGGDIGNAMRKACDAWLQAAAQVGAPPEQVAREIKRLYDSDHYGGRERLLGHASAALPESELRALVLGFQNSLEVLARPPIERQNLPIEVFKLSGALSLLSEALRDPEVRVKAVMTYSPHPNSLQRAEFAKEFLRCGFPDKAMLWLEEPWAGSDIERHRLRAQVLIAMGRNDEAAEVRRVVFEDSGLLHDFQEWAKLVAPGQSAQARSAAMRKAMGHDDVVEAAMLLMAIDEADAAERLLESRHDAVDGGFYGRLSDLADALLAHGKVVGSIVCYRALLLGVLGRGKSTAYAHGAAYLMRLRALAKAPYRDALLESHDAFEARLRAIHGRKTAFWRRV